MDLQPAQRMLLIVGACAGVTGILIIVTIVWCCLARRSSLRAGQAPESPGTASLLFR